MRKGIRTTPLLILFALVSCSKQTPTDLGEDIPIPPPPIVEEVVGYLGASISNNAVEGRNLLGNSPWWDVIVEFGGMNIHRWGEVPEHKNWALFKQAQAENPASVLWVHILIADRNVPGILPEDINTINNVVERLQKYAPSTETTFASGLPDFHPGCKTPGAFGVETSRLLVEYGISMGFWIQGPNLEKLTEELTNGEEDPCHQNELGKQIHGQQLLREIG